MTLNYEQQICYLVVLVGDPWLLSAMSRTVFDPSSSLKYIVGFCCKTSVNIMVY
jgi:hypothetical protein